MGVVFGGGEGIVFEGDVVAVGVAAGVIAGDWATRSGRGVGGGASVGASSISTANVVCPATIRSPLRTTASSTFRPLRNVPLLLPKSRIWQLSRLHSTAKWRLEMRSGGDRGLCGADDPGGSGP